VNFGYNHFFGLLCLVEFFLKSVLKKLFNDLLQRNCQNQNNHNNNQLQQKHLNMKWNKSLEKYASIARKARL